MVKNQKICILLPNSCKKWSLWITGLFSFFMHCHHKESKHNQASLSTGLQEVISFSKKLPSILYKQVGPFFKKGQTRYEINLLAGLDKESSKEPSVVLLLDSEVAVDANEVIWLQQKNRDEKVQEYSCYLEKAKVYIQLEGEPFIKREQERQDESRCFEVVQDTSTLLELIHFTWQKEGPIIKKNGQSEQRFIRWKLIYSPGDLKQSKRWTGKMLSHLDLEKAQFRINQAIGFVDMDEKQNLVYAVKIDVQLSVVRSYPIEKKAPEAISVKISHETEYEYGAKKVIIKKPTAIEEISYRQRTILEERKFGLRKK